MKNKEKKEVTPNQNKRIDFKAGKFLANGRMYYLQFDSLSIERYKIYEKLVPSLTISEVY